MVAAPRIGFVVPVYRPPLDVFDAMLRSVVAQSVPDWECILVDDGSEDPMLTERLAVAAADDRFRVVVADRNGGIAAATNLGLAALRAPVFALADHDDLLAADAAEAVLAIFDEDPGVGLIYSDESTIDERGDTIATHRKPDFSPIRLQGQHYLNHLMAARTELIGELEVRTEFEPTQDLDFVVRLIASAERSGQRAMHVARTLYGWRAIAGSSAADVAEKPGMVNAAYRSFQAELERRGVGVEISNALDAAGRLTATCVLEFELPADDEIDLVQIATSADDVDAASVVAAVADGTARFVALVPAIESAPANWTRIVASEAGRDGVGAAGPCLVDGSGRVVSTGRVVVPTLSDLFAGSVLDDGPFGANQATREATALHPAGMVLDRQTFADAGVGFGVDLDSRWATSLDVIVAGWGLQLQRHGRSVVWTPRARLVVAEPGLVDAAAWTDWVDAHGQPDEPYSPGGSIPASGARRSRRARLARASGPDATLVVTGSAAAASSTIAAAAESSRATSITPTEVDSGSTESGFPDAVSAAVEQVAGAERATVVLAGEPAELLSDPRLVEPLITGGTRGSVDGATLIPVTPLPWPDWLDWSSALAPAPAMSPAVGERIRSWLFDLGADEPDPNTQIGAALAPALVATITAVFDAAEHAGLTDIIVSDEVAWLADALRDWAPNPTLDGDAFRVASFGDTGAQSISVEHSVFVGWGAADRPAETWAVNVLIDEVLSASRASLGAQQVLHRFFDDPAGDEIGPVPPGLAATRRTALACADRELQGVTGQAVVDRQDAAGAPASAASADWAAATIHLVERLVNGERAEIYVSLAIWWDRRFDGPLPRWAEPTNWYDRFAVAADAERDELLGAVAGSVPHWLARMVLETTRGQIGGHAVAMLAAFERDRDDPVADQRTVYGDIPRRRRHRYRATQQSLRAVAFSAGLEPGRVELVSLRVRVIGQHETRELDLASMLDSVPAGVVLHWIDTCPRDDHTWLQRGDGQLVIELPGLGAELFDGLEADPVPTVEIEVEFGFEKVEPDNPIFAERFADFARNRHGGPGTGDAGSGVSSTAAAHGGGVLSRLQRLVRR